MKDYSIKCTPGEVIGVTGMVVFMLVLVLGTTCLEWVLFDFAPPWMRVTAIALSWVITSLIVWKGLMGERN